MLYAKKEVEKTGIKLREFQQKLAEIDFREPFTPTEAQAIREFKEWLWGRKIEQD